MPNPIDLQKALSGASYPSSKEDLIAHAKSNGADQDILDGLQEFPDGEISGSDQLQKASSDLLTAHRGLQFFLADLAHRLAHRPQMAERVA